MEASTNGWSCVIAEDNMSATLLINPPSDDIPYQVEDVMEFLRQKGIKEGINYSEVERIVSAGIYDQEVVVAKGREAIDGKEGYYDFFFDMGTIKTPTIRSDGSVDYQSMNIVHSIKKDEVLAVYKHAVPGVHGYDVKGRELRAKPAKELPEIKGSGFVKEDDGVTYRATIEGRVEYSNFKLYVRELYEHKGDLDLVTGRIDFRGDVIIHGNVRTGTMIRASKSITIEGNVEGAILIAEGDIVLKKGMQGGQKAKIIAGGDVYAYFIEYTEVSAKGSVEANIIMNCKVSAGKSITVKGRKGFIVGGNYYAVSLIESTSIGNPAEVKTYCTVGVTKELSERNHLLMTKLEATKKGISSAKQAIELLNDPGLCKDPQNVRDAKINQLKRRLKRDERMLEHVSKEVEEIRHTMEVSKNSRISAEGTVYPGVVVRVDDKEMCIQGEAKAVDFKKKSLDGDIVMSGIRR